jgi:hypothetical protein
LWEKGEDYIIRLYKIPFSKLKLSLWSFILEFPESYDNLNTNLQQSKEICNIIRENIYLKKLLSHILTIGNILNAGSQKGQADGFNLDILSKLSGTKDINNKTVTQLVVSQIHSEDLGIENIKKQFSLFSEITKFCYSDIESNINKLKNEFNANKTKIEKINIEDQFTKEAQKIMEKYNKEIESITLLFPEVNKLVKDTILYYGYSEKDPKYKTPDEFFIIINDFINEVDRSLPKQEVKKVFNRKYEIGQKITETKKNTSSSNNNNNQMEELLKAMKSRSGA